MIFPKRKSSGLALHAANVALTPARVITSYLRRLYERRYRGRHRYAPWVFAFDLSLVGIALGLIILNVYLFQFSPSIESKVGLVFSAPPIVSGAPLAFEASVVSRDVTTHQDVRLAWDLPPGTEILSAAPPLDEHHEAFLGALKPGEKLEARITVRLFVPPGSVQLGFRMRDALGRLAGSELRPITKSGLTFEPLIHPTKFVSGASLPYLLKNTTAQALETVEVAAGGGATIEGKSRVSIGTLAPFEERLLLVDLARSSSLTLQALSHGVALDVDSLAAQESRESFPVTSLTLSPSTPGQQTIVDVQSFAPAQLLVFHPALKDAKDSMRIFAVTTGTQHIVLPLDQTFTNPVDRWIAVPFVKQGDELTLGRTAIGVVTTRFLLTTAARYYAATGDQIGVGPLPPRVGQTTKYWVSWKIAPTTSDLSHLQVRALLPPQVQLTGRQALPDGGVLDVESGSVVWKLDFLPATSEGAMAAFEVSLTPTRDMQGKIPGLLGSATAEATDNHVQAEVQSQAGAVDAGLIGDEKAAGKGTVK